LPPSNTKTNGTNDDGDYAYILHKCNRENDDDGTTNSKEANMISGWKYFSLGTALTCPFRSSGVSTLHKNIYSTSSNIPDTTQI
jgi:hypothetical protein